MDASLETDNLRKVTTALLDVIFNAELFTCFTPFEARRISRVGAVPPCPPWSVEDW
jgi:hypothetical protein